jgi:hypothetical protein
MRERQRDYARKQVFSRSAAPSVWGFMPDALRSEFQSLVDLLRGAQVERELQFQHPQIPRKDWGNSVSNFFENGDRTLQELAGNVNRRLFRNEL